MEFQYQIEVDTVDKNQWYEIMKLFSDSNTYQTWAYDEIIGGENNISHLVLKKEGEIVSACQVRIINVRYLNIGIAYVRWGPLWILNNMEPDINIFRKIIVSIIEEYVYKRKFMLRICLKPDNENNDLCLKILEENKFGPEKYYNNTYTLIMELYKSLEEIRKDMDSKWRNRLNKAEKDKFIVREGETPEYIELFIKMYKEMVARKGFIEPNNIYDFEKMQNRLPDYYKMKVMICYLNDEPCAGAICSAIGDTGIYLFGATSDFGMKSSGSYLLQWKLIEWMKDIGCKKYDLNGINLNRNPGTYHFKKGLSGKNCIEYKVPRQYDFNISSYQYYAMEYIDYIKKATGNNKYIYNAIGHIKRVLLQR